MLEIRATLNSSQSRKTIADYNQLSMKGLTKFVLVVVYQPTQKHSTESESGP